MSNVSAWDTSDSGNTSAPPAGAPEGMAPGSVNDTMRAIFGAVARWYQDTNGTLETGGTANTRTLTTNNGHAALADLSLLVFLSHAANSGAVTLNVDGLGAKSLRYAKTALASGALAEHSMVIAVYNAEDDAFDMVNPPAVLPVALGGTGAASASAARTALGLAIGSDVQAYSAILAAIVGLARTDGNFIVGNGTTWVAESGATARASLGLGSLATASSINNGNWSGTDLAVANGGTGASTAANARSNLGIGSMATRAVTITTDATPSGGSDGDIWLVYEA